jgi:hypothetical protein
MERKIVAGSNPTAATISFEPLLVFLYCLESILRLFRILHLDNIPYCMVWFLYHKMLRKNNEAMEEAGLVKGGIRDIRQIW